MNCPFCNGKGKVEHQILLDRVERRAMARKLRKLGYPILKVMSAVGYKSPRSVVLACNRKD